jgi:hypothetical protein
MISHFKLISLLGIFTFLSTGCSNLYSVKYDSTPRGATLICGGQNKGYTPQTLRYNPPENGVLLTEPCSANWVSGVNNNYQRNIDLKPFPNGLVITLPRPDVEGYEKDAEFALRVENLRLQKQQADAASRAATDAAIDQIFNTDKSITCDTFGRTTTCQ